MEQAVFYSMVPTIREEFCPPKPKALDMAAFGFASRPSSVTGTRGQSASGAVQPRLGGSSPVSRALMQTISYVTPPAPIMCPVAPLVELTGGASSPKTARMAAASAASPLRVAVPWALI